MQNGWILLSGDPGIPFALAPVMAHGLLYFLHRGLTCHRSTRDS